MSIDPVPASLRVRRMGATVVTALALLAVQSCTHASAGQAVAPSESVSEYRTFVSQSLSTSRSLESQSLESSSQQAMTDACTTFSMASGAAVLAGNDLIKSMNDEGGYGSTSEQKVGPVIDALNTSATQVDGAKGQAQTDELRDALSAYSDKARKLASAFQSRLVNDPLNIVVGTFNSARENADGLCSPFLTQKPG